MALGIQWPKDELDAAKADDFAQKSAERMAQFTERTKALLTPAPEPALPAAAPVTLDRASLTPWLDNAVTGAGQVVQQAGQAATNWLSDRSSLMPWAEPPRADATSSPSGFAGAQPDPTLPNLPGMRGPVQGPTEGIPGAAVPAGDLRAAARAAAQKYGVDPGIYERQIQQESNFNPNAVSQAGAKGIAQFMDPTARAMGLADPFDPIAALDAGARHMKQNLDRNNGDYRAALAAYNAGQGAIDKYGIDGVLADDFAHGQTRDYVRIILGGQAAPAPTAGAVSPPAPAAQAPAAGPPPAAGAASDQITVRNKRTGLVTSMPAGAWDQVTDQNQYDIVPPVAQAQPDAPPMLRQSLSQPEDVPPDQLAPFVQPQSETSGPKPRPSPNIEPLGPALRGVTPGPAYDDASLPGARNRPVPGPYPDETGGGLVTPGPDDRARLISDQYGAIPLPERNVNRDALQTGGTLWPPREQAGNASDSPTMYRQPLGQTNVQDEGGEYDPRQADEGAHEWGSRQDPERVRAALDAVTNEPTDQPVPSYNDPTAGGTLDQPLPSTPAPTVTDPEGPPGWRKLYDAAGNFVHWIQGNVEQNRQNVTDANAGQTDGPDFGTGAQNAWENVVKPAGQKAVEAGVASAQPPTNVQEAVQQGFTGPIRGLQIVQDTIAAFGDEAGRRVAAELGIPDDEVANLFGHSITKHDVAGFVGSTVLDPTNYIGAGEAPRAARAVEEAAAPAVRRGAASLGEAARSAGRRVSEALPDAGPAPLGQPMYGTLGVTPNGPRRWRTPSEQELRSEVGTRIQDVPDAVRGPESIERVQAARNETPYDNSPVPPNFDQQPLVRDTTSPTNSINLNATPGVSPSTGSGLGTRLAADVANSFGGGVAGATVGGGLPAETDEERRRNALLGAGVGMLAGPAAGRLIPRGEGALAMLGAAPNGPRRRLRSAEIAGQQAIKMTPSEEVSRLRLDKFPAELRDDIQKGAESTGFAHEQRRGVLPDQAVQDLADTDTRTVDDWIKKGKAGRSYNAEETVALRNSVTTQANTVRDLTDRIAAAKTEGLDPVLLNARRVAESQKLAALVQTAEGARAEAGRTLRAYRATTRILESNDPSDAARRILKNVNADPEEAGRLLDTFNEIVQNGGSPIDLAKFWAKAENPPIGWKDWFVALRYNSMLSGLSTHLVNIVGNAVEVPWRLLRDTGASIGRGDLRPMVPELKGVASGFSAGLHAGWETLLHGLTTAQAEAGGVPRDLINRARNPIEKGAAVALEAPGRLLGAADQFGQQIAYHMGLGREAGLMASREGLKGPAWNQRVAGLLAAPPDELSKAAQSISDRMTFKGDMGRNGAALNQFLRKIDPALSNIIMPFMKTVYHITSRGLDRSPVGLGSTLMDLAKGKYAKGKVLEQGMVPLGEKVGDAVMGTAVFGLGTYWALSGNLSASGPSDPAERDALRAQGWQPYSAKIGDKWVSYANLGPLAMPLSMAAAVGESQRYKDASKPSETQFLEGGKRFAEVFTEQTYLNSFGQLYKSISDPVRYGDAYATSLLGSMVPYGSALNAVGQAQDPVARRPERLQDVGVIENTRQSLASRNVPFTGGRESVPAAQDVLGRPDPNIRYGLDAGSPFRVSPERPDPTIQAFLDANVNISRPPDTLSLGGGAQIELKPAEQRMWQTERGKLLQQYASKFTDAPWWQNPDAREKAMKSLIADANQAAGAQIQAKLGAPEIQRRAQEALQKKHAKQAI